MTNKFNILALVYAVKKLAKANIGGGKMASFVECSVLQER
jgi:hypothetical protein